MNTGEVWWVRFPYEDEPQQYKVRPAIVLDDGQMGVLSVKVTKHYPREEDSYDVALFDWGEAGLQLASTARISKTIVIDNTMFLNYIGMLSESDLNRVLSSYMDYISSRIESSESDNTEEILRA